MPRSCSSGSTRSPRLAFNQAATFFGILEVVWDTTSVVFNSAVDIINVGLIPVWNSAVYYIVEPILSLALEIFSIVFLRQSFPGVLPDDFGYTGFDCTASADAMAWCGRYDHYAKELESGENAPYYAARARRTRAWARRRPPRAAPSSSPPRATRRTSSAWRPRGGCAHSRDSDDIPLPAMRLGPLVTALDALSTFFLSIFPMLCDMFFAIAQEVLITSFSVIMDVIQTVLEQLMTTAKMLIKSGILTTLMGVGVDFLVIMFTELALPLLFAAIDLLMCVLDLFKRRRGGGPSSSASRTRASRGPASRPTCSSSRACPSCCTASRPSWTRCSTRARASASATASRRASSPPRGARQDGLTGTPIDNEEPETASAGNPINEFSLADDFADFLGTSASDKCAQCFVCKVIFGNTQTQSHYTHDIQVTSTLNPNQVPEARLLWLLAASIGSLFSTSGFNTFTGNVTDHCLAQRLVVRRRVRPARRRGAALPAVARRPVHGRLCADRRAHLRLVRRAGASTWPRRRARANTDSSPSSCRRRTSGRRCARTRTSDEKAAVFVYHM